MVFIYNHQSRPIKRSEIKKKSNSYIYNCCCCVIDAAAGGKRIIMGIYMSFMMHFNVLSCHIMLMIYRDQYCGLLCVQLKNKIETMYAANHI